MVRLLSVREPTGPDRSLSGGREMSEYRHDRMEERVRRRYFNGVKTAVLFGLLWAVMLGLGSFVGGGRFIWLFVALGVLGTAYGYWNSASIAIRAMRARPVSEVEQPALYRIVRELSTAARQPMPRLYVSPTVAPNAFATGRNPRERRGLLHRGHPADPRRARAARRARPRAVARLQPRHPDLVGRGALARRRDHVRRAACLADPDRRRPTTTTAATRSACC